MCPWFPGGQASRSPRGPADAPLWPCRALRCRGETPGRRDGATPRDWRVTARGKNATKKDDFEMIQGGHKKIVAVFSRCKNKHKNNDVNQPLEILSNGRTSWSSTFFGDGKDQTSDMMHGTMADNWVEDGRRTFWVAALIDQMVVVRTVWKGWLEPTRSWPAERPKKEMALPMGKKEELWVVNVLKILDFELQRWWLDVMSGPKRISEKATRTGSLNASINIS